MGAGRRSWLSRAPDSWFLDFQLKPTQPFIYPVLMDWHRTSLAWIKHWPVHRLATASRNIRQIHIQIASATSRIRKRGASHKRICCRRQLCFALLWPGLPITLWTPNNTTSLIVMIAFMICLFQLCIHSCNKEDPVHSEAVNDCNMDSWDRNSVSCFLLF